MEVKLKGVAHPFETDYNDHFEIPNFSVTQNFYRKFEEIEKTWPWWGRTIQSYFKTPREAYEHIVPLLDGIAQTLYGSTSCKQLYFNKNSRDKLTIYDPFYCNGAVVTHLNALGFTKVVHENRDFYADK